MFRRLLRSGSPEKPWILGERGIHLHLGAHKTATTYIQKNLARNKAALLDHGVLYLSLPETRSKVSKHLVALSKTSRGQSGLAKHREAVLDGLGRDDLERCHTVLISDENLTGGPGGFRKGKIYQSIPQDWAHIHDELGPNISVSFSIRDYPGYFASLYSEMLRNHRYFPFHRIGKLFGEFPTLWSDVHRDLSTVFGSDKVTFWDFRDTVANPAAVFAMLTGLDLPFEIRETPVRESLSAAAIEFIRDFQKLPGRELPPKVIAEVGKRLYPLVDHPGKFDPYEAEERAALTAHYRAERNRLPVRSF